MYETNEGKRARNDTVAFATVGREGVVCGGRGGRGRRVALSVFLQARNPYRRGSNFPSALSLFHPSMLVRATYDA